MMHTNTQTHIYTYSDLLSVAYMLYKAEIMRHAVRIEITTVSYSEISLLTITLLRSAE